MGIKGVNINIKVESHAKEAINAKNQMVEKALEAMGLQCEKYAKMLCPVDTGRLRNSITHDVRMDEEAVYVGTATEYAPYVLRRVWPFTRGGSLCSCHW